jgi:uncharacterized protein YjbI with pentapeptide repeats
MRRIPLLVSLAGALVPLAALLAVIVYLPQLAIDPYGLSRPDWLKAVQDLRTTILQGLGGLALLGTLYFSARTLQLNRRGQMTERFTKAIEQLGSERLAIRLGGIYALESIALESVEWHWSVMEVLTAFMREHPTAEKTPQRNEAAGADDPVRADRTPQTQARLGADLQAIATVVGRRSRQRRRHERRKRHPMLLSYRLDLEGIWLVGADLGGAHLEGAILGGAHLEVAQLTGAHLEGALLWDAHLRGACLSHARLQGANLSGADLREAELDLAYLRRADLAGAWLRGANLAFACLAGADLRGARINGAKLDGADLTKAQLDGSDLTRRQLESARYDSSTILPEHLREGSVASDSERG